MGHADPILDVNVMDYQWIPFTPNRDFRKEPKIFVRAEGVHYWSDKGDKILDGSSGLFCVPLGHGRREIADAVHQQLLELDFAGAFCRSHPKAFQLAKKIAEFTPAGMNRVFFTNSGSEAVDTAMKIALAYHRAKGEGGRNMFVSRERPRQRRAASGSRAVRNRDVRTGCGGRGAYALDGAARTGSSGDSRRGRGTRGPQALIAHGAKNMAAVFIGPIAGSTGCLPPPVGYLERVRELCTNNGILLVFDEVINGLGRTGYDFASKAFNVTPDILTMAKALTNGMQTMSAVAVRQDIHDIVNRGPEHRSSSFTAIPTRASGIVRGGPCDLESTSARTRSRKRANWASISSTPVRAAGPAVHGRYPRLWLMGHSI